jgi:hypothetical protein
MTRRPRFLRGTPQLSAQFGDAPSDVPRAAPLTRAVFLNADLAHVDCQPEDGSRAYALTVTEDEKLEASPSGGEITLS